MDICDNMFEVIILQSCQARAIFIQVLKKGGVLHSLKEEDIGISEIIFKMVGRRMPKETEAQGLINKLN